MNEFRDIMRLHEAKRVEAQKALANSFLLWVNAPDEELDRQGYLFLGSPVKHESDRFDHFRYFVVGARSADIRDVQELLVLGDSETRSEYSEEGDDYHAIVGARIIAEYLKLVVRGGDEPLATAAETVLRDETGELIVIHFDGEYERLKLDHKPWVKFLGGSRDPDVVRAIELLAKKHLKLDEFHPDQTNYLLDMLRQQFSPFGITDIQRWKLNNLVSEDPVPEQLED